MHVVGLSILSGSHLPLVTEVMERMRAAGLDDIPVVVGGIIPDADAEALARRRRRPRLHPQGLRAQPHHARHRRPRRRHRPRGSLTRPTARRTGPLHLLGPNTRAAGSRALRPRPDGIPRQPGRSAADPAHANPPRHLRRPRRHLVDPRADLRLGRGLLRRARRRPRGSLRLLVLGPGPRGLRRRDRRRHPRHLLPPPQPGRRRRACGECRLRDFPGRARQGHRPRASRPLVGDGPRPRLPRHAVQLRRRDQHPRHRHLGGRRLRHRRPPPRRLRATRLGYVDALVMFREL